MPDQKTYIEEKRLVNESACKWMKRIIVGFIRHYESENDEANIPEDFFDDVPDNVGFTYDFFEAEDNSDLRCFHLIDTWKLGQDDCGGDETPSDEITYNVTETATTPGAVAKTHLKLIVDNESPRK